MSALNVCIETCGSNLLKISVKSSAAHNAVEEALRRAETRNQQLEQVIDLAGAAGMKISAVDEAGSSIAGSSKATGEYYHGQGFDTVESVSDTERT